MNKEWTLTALQIRHYSTFDFNEISLTNWSILSVMFIFFSIDCPNGITNIKAATGQIAHPGSSINYGVNETKCWKIQVPDVYEGIGIYYHV